MDPVLQILNNLEKHTILHLSHSFYLLSICLTLSWRRFLWYRNQSMDWLLYDWDLRHEIFKGENRLKCTVLRGVFRTQSNRSTPPEVFLVKGVLKICGKFTREHPCGSVISSKLRCRSVFQWSCKATLLKSHFRMGALL